MKKVLLQGAMESEIDYLAEQVSHMKDYEVIRADNFEFFCGSEEQKRYIVSRTGMGTVNAAIATAYAVMKFHPACIINQGIAGAQTKELSTGDLVLAEQAVNINAMIMPKKELGEGSDPFGWEGFHTEYLKADKLLLELFLSHDYTMGKMVKGTVATGDFFSRETDRILWLKEKYGSLCEDMETASVYAACKKLEVPCIGIRMISNNELIHEGLNEKTAQLLQEHVFKIIHDFL